MAWVALTIIGILALIIGIGMVIGGIIWYENNLRKSLAQSGWVWFLIIGGAIIAILGGILLGYGLYTRSSEVMVYPTSPYPVYPVSHPSYPPPVGVNYVQPPEYGY